MYQLFIKDIRINSTPLDRGSSLVRSSALYSVRQEDTKSMFRENRSKIEDQKGCLCRFDEKRAASLQIKDTQTTKERYTTFS